MPHAILSLDTRHAGWVSFHIATLRLPDGTQILREIEEHGPAVAILPYDPARRVALLVRQFRTPAFFAAGVETVLECPAGLLEEPDAEAGARREAEEEVGVTLGTLERAGFAWAMPGVSTERMHLFLAAYAEADRRSAGGGLAAEHEHIEVAEMPLSRLAAMAEDGTLDDMKTLCLVQTLRLRRPDLFADDAESASGFR